MDILTTTVRKAIPLMLVLLTGCLSDITEFVDSARTTAKIGVLAHTEVTWITESARIEKAFRFYRQNKVDAVVITGNVTQDGYKDQFSVLDKVWKKVFKGQSTKLIITPGDYDINGFKFAVSTHRPLRKCNKPTFYAREKLPLTDELCFYPRDSKAICAGSMSGITIRKGYTCDGDLESKSKRVSQGLLVTVYSDTVVIRRLDFTVGQPLDKSLAAEIRHKRMVYAEDVAEPWTIGEETTRDPAPEFWPDTRLQVFVGQDKGETIYTVKWPNVLKRFTGARARQYEAEVAWSDEPDRPLLHKTVLSSGYYQSEERDSAGVKCIFKAKDIPNLREKPANLVFSVTPVGTYGKSGKTIRSQEIPYRQE